MFPNLIPMTTHGSGSISTSSALAVPTDRLELEVDDLCIWTGKQSEHSVYRNRIIYRVVEKRWVEPKLMPSGNQVSGYHSVRFAVAYDLENPMGQSFDSVGFANIREMKKLSLVDLGIIRLTFDNFVREWAKRQGMAEPADDVR